jgi:hypothetical protein
MHGTHNLTLIIDLTAKILRFYSLMLLASRLSLDELDLVKGESIA